MYLIFKHSLYYNSFKKRATKFICSSVFNIFNGLETDKVEPYLFFFSNAFSFS